MERIPTAVDTERWFVRRGVPHFVVDYSATGDILTRAAPVLVLVFLISAISAGDLDWSWWALILASLGGLAILVVAWGLVNLGRGRRFLALPERIGAVEIGVYLLVPALLPLFFGGDWRGAVITFVSLSIILGIVYLTAAYSLIELAIWSVAQLIRTLGRTLRLFTRGLPLLLIGFMFIFINAEAWQSAGTLDSGLLVFASLALAALAALFLATQIPNEMRDLGSFTSWAEAAALCEEAPVDVDGPLPGTAPDPPPLRRRERFNVWLVFFVSQMARLVLVSALVGLLFVGLGLVLIQPDTVELWIGAPPDILLTITIGSNTLHLSRELLQVSGFLAAFAAVYFSVYAATDTSLRVEFFEGTVGEMRQNLAVRAVYRLRLSGAGSA